MKRFSLVEIQSLVHTALTERHHDAEKAEAESITSCLLTSFGLSAVGLALAAKLRGETLAVLKFHSRAGLDFDELRRDQLVSEFDAASGVGHEASLNVVQTIERVIAAGLEGDGAVEVERLGEFRPDPAGGWSLLLSESLRIAPRTHRPSGENRALQRA
ncbi:MAG TPA: hypothetical protein VF483_02845 [Gemmatimonadaceae bacterium]